MSIDSPYPGLIISREGLFRLVEVVNRLRSEMSGLEGGGSVWTQAAASPPVDSGLAGAAGGEPTGGGPAVGGHGNTSGAEAGSEPGR